MKSWWRNEGLPGGDVLPCMQPHKWHESRNGLLWPNEGRLYTKKVPIFDPILTINVILFMPMVWEWRHLCEKSKIALSYDIYWGSEKISYACACEMLIHIRPSDTPSRQNIVVRSRSYECYIFKARLLPILPQFCLCYSVVIFMIFMVIYVTCQTNMQETWYCSWSV